MVILGNCTLTQIICVIWVLYVVSLLDFVTSHARTGFMRSDLSKCSQRSQKERRSAQCSALRHADTVGVSEKKRTLSEHRSK